MKKDRSAALPLLFAGLILAAGVAALFIPLFDCPPCLGFGHIQTGPEAMNLYECRLCDGRGRLPGPMRLRADTNPERHRGAFDGTASRSHDLDCPANWAR